MAEAAVVPALSTALKTSSLIPLCSGTRSSMNRSVTRRLRTIPIPAAKRLSNRCCVCSFTFSNAPSHCSFQLSRFIPRRVNLKPSDAWLMRSATTAQGDRTFGIRPTLDNHSSVSRAQKRNAVLWRPPFGSLLARRRFFPGGWRRHRRLPVPLGAFFAGGRDLPRPWFLPRRGVSRPGGPDRALSLRRQGFFSRPPW
jgi:hypothetical protein